MNIGALAGSMPANVSENVRAIVTAGFAKLVEEVKKYAPAMYAATDTATQWSFRVQTTPIITIKRPKVAMISDNQSAGSERSRVDQLIASSSKITFAATTPRMPPIT